jgi:hypothetical protein
MPKMDVHQEAVVEEAILVGVGFALGMLILIISMVLTSAFMGGVEFGALHMVLLKAVPLIMVVTFVALLPGALGFFLPLPVWWFGLMIVFRLDFWEARTLVITNWILNVLAHLLLLTLLK